MTIAPPDDAITVEPWDVDDDGPYRLFSSLVRQVGDSVVIEAGGVQRPDSLERVVYIYGPLANDVIELKTPDHLDELADAISVIRDAKLI